MVCFKTIRWSTIEHPGLPAAWAFVIVTCFFTLSLMILSYSFPTLLASVIPLSFEHFPFSSLPLYSLIISPSSQLRGVSSSLWTFSSISFRTFLVSLFASMKISFGILSGPRLLFLFSFFIAAFISFSLIWSSVSVAVSGSFSRFFLTWVFILLVHSAYSAVPSLA